MPADPLFTRDEAMGGLPARRASILLYLIESRTAHLVAHSRWAMARFLTEQAIQERELAFVEAFALGREPPLRPTIQDLERYAPQWASLVPENPSLRAALANSLGQKYSLAATRTPRIRAALGLGQPAVQQAYLRLYRQPLERIYAPRVTLIGRLRWAAARWAVMVESIPPFWAAFAITLTETVGAGILALPVAIASIGPLAGLVVLALMGVLNVLTVVAMAEALSRSGVVRYGGGYFGRMVADLLGGIGSLVFSLGIAVLDFAVLIAYFVGFATTLAAATRLSPMLWGVVLFLLILFYLCRKKLDATIASALLVGFSSIGLILLLSVLASTQVRVANLLYVQIPFLNGQPFRPELVQLIFGTILTSYFGHTSMGSCARVVLRRDPSARSLIYGSATAILASMALYAIWVLAVNGAIAPQTLATETATALVPLTARVGPSVGVVGSVYVILSIAMVSIHLALGLFHVVQERLPARQTPVVLLPRRRGRLIFSRRGWAGRAPRLVLTYLGLAAAREGSLPRFSLDIQDKGHTESLEMVIGDRWDETALGERMPGLAKGRARLALEVLDANPDSARLRVSSSLVLAYEGEWDTSGLHLADLLELPDDRRQLLQRMMRKQYVTLPDLATYSRQDESAVRSILADLMEKGLVREVNVAGRIGYRAQLGHRRKSALPEEVWTKLSGGTTPGQVVTPRWGTHTIMQWTRQALQGGPLRFALGLLPSLVVFLLVEWLLMSKQGSFSGLLSLVGTIVASLLGGVFPMLLLIASRRKGELVPGVSWRWLGHPVLLATIYAVYLGSILLHGFVIWRNPWERAAASVVAVLVVLMTGAMWRRRAFDPRTVIELGQDGKDGPISFAATTNGQPGAVEVSLHYPEGEQCCQVAFGEIARPAALHYAIFKVLGHPGQELKVWTHTESPDTDSGPLPVLLEVHTGEEITHHDLRLTGGQLVLPPCHQPRWLKVTFQYAASVSAPQ